MSHVLQIIRPAAAAVFQLKCSRAHRWHEIYRYANDHISPHRARIFVCRQNNATASARVLLVFVSIAIVLLPSILPMKSNHFLVRIYSVDDDNDGPFGWILKGTTSYMWWMLMSPPRWCALDISHQIWHYWQWVGAAVAANKPPHILAY